MNILFIHGRNQHNQLPYVLKFNWLESLKDSFANSSIEFPNDIYIHMPFFGYRLEYLARRHGPPLFEDDNYKNIISSNNFMDFWISSLTDLSIIDNQHNKTIGSSFEDKGDKGITSNPSFINIISKIDKTIPVATKLSIFYFLRDAYLYIYHAGIKAEIDNIVKGDILKSPSIIIAHSLGSIVAYNILRNIDNEIEIPLLITIGSPLGITAIRNEFKPITYPSSIKEWHNIKCNADIISTNELNEKNFPTKRNIINHNIINAPKEDPHSALNYLKSNILCDLINNLIHNNNI